MEKWQLFEKNATELLSSEINVVNFQNVGGTDSTVSDIKVIKNETIITTIEAKYSPCQSGQIVILINGNSFIFSTASINNSNIYTNQIISYLNSNFNLYSSVGTSSIPINISSNILFSWIKAMYSEKGVSWIISSSQYENLNNSNTCFISLNDIDNYFEISASLRRKKSGTVHLPTSRRNEFELLLKQITTNYNLTKTGTKYKLELFSNTMNKYVGTEFFLSETNQRNIYYVKKRSSTNNINIMFSLKLKRNIDFKIDRFKEVYSL